MAETVEDQPVWVHNACGTFRNSKLLNSHYRKHGADFGARSAAEYEALARGFMTGKAPKGVLEGVRKSNGDMLRYDPSTEAFGVIAKDGTIKTYFKPDTGIHGLNSNLDYFYDNLLRK